jgi:hypothetical protein
MPGLGQNFPHRWMCLCYMHLHAGDSEQECFREMHVPVFLMCRNAGDGASRSAGNLCMCKDAPSTMCMCMGVHPEKCQLAVHGPGIGEQQPAGALA